MFAISRHESTLNTTCLIFGEFYPRAKSSATYEIAEGIPQTPENVQKAFRLQLIFYFCYSEAKMLVARNRKTFSVSLGLCEGIHHFPGFPTQRVMRSYGFSLMSFSTNRSVFWEARPLFDVGVYMLLSKRIHAEWKRSRQCVTVRKFTSL